MSIARLLAFIAAFALTSPTGAVTVSTDTAGLSDTQRAISDAALARAASMLPTAWSDALRAPLRVRWRDDLPPDVEGRYVPGTLTLRRGLLDTSTPLAPSRELLAATLHELAHAWDRSPQGGLSRDPRLLDLAGWSVAPLGGRVARNDFRDRSPDAYERTDPREFVAVNLEHFLLDADYACRRPELAQWFATRAGRDQPARECGAPVFAQPRPVGAADESPLLALDPARVYAVDYLLAGPDTQPMSRWGHSMLRLVICAPGHASGPECRLDIAWHVVLSFRAFVDDVQLSSWRGLTGDYPSRLFLLPMPQVIDEYTKVELRDLTSLPLKLSRGEIASLVERAAQVHWSYDGRYRFVSRNCAVDTWTLLHDGVPRLASIDLRSFTPTGLQSKLVHAGIADAHVLDDADTARRVGYRFDSQAQHYAQLFDVAKSSLPLPARDFAAWLDLPASQRTSWIERGDLKATAALLVLETAALRRAELRAADEVKHRLLHDRDAAIDGLRAGTNAAIATAARLARPAAFAPDGYGLPTMDERAGITARLAAEASLANRQEDALRAAADALLAPPQRDDLHDARDNVERLGKRLRMLSTAAAI
ncbi:DUF4105 domain-containing protein [Lysobacter sp. TY2-98]|uniref:DUF7844 domain-containing protein n=1 Tax=Lysobacter sp. TY2-98 TaxID=2290922 RepID=UPI000E2010CA|nr:DUF4105 domain-containing protein [Lysobacter sp. TY2-98]AXK72089.1 DUF4105 domain-containing protein [Lysobacter sp. TY2-98]